ncbi:MAG: family 20 glycosylhydrolase [Bacteroidales bacterium]|jgi:N-acetyl-beta-hexosaminidase
MRYLFATLLISVSCTLYSQHGTAVRTTREKPAIVRGFCIAAPRPERMNEFISFVEKELAPRHVNTLILMVDYNFRFKSHPELRDDSAISAKDAKRLARTCKKLNIDLIPEMDLLGHQSRANSSGTLLRVHPEFDETPQVKMPDKYIWPNPEGLYCKSYCPLHPGVHKIVFDLIDELCDAFESDSFHAGMDEVFYIGESQCPRCSGKDKAELFACEVRAIHDHLAEKGRSLWIWGDRLIDGKSTGIGEWEGSFNCTFRAIDMIPKDITICDWHYERPDQTPVYFAIKGFDVVTCFWNRSASAILQDQDMQKFRDHSTTEMKEHFRGLLQTVWSGAGSFLDIFYGNKPDSSKNSEVDCFRTLFPETKKINVGE